MLAARGLPSRNRLPLAAGNRPAITRAKVDLPDPDSPIIPKQKQLLFLNS